MKIKNGFVLRKVAGQNVVVAIGEASRLLNGMIQLNNTGVFLWTLLQEGIKKDELLLKMAENYGLSTEQASKDLEAFLDTLNSVGCIEQ